MKRAAVSRADLLDALVVAGQRGSYSAALLGFERPAAVKTTDERPNRVEAGQTVSAPKNPSTHQPITPVEYPTPHPGQRTLQFLLPRVVEVLTAEQNTTEEPVRALTDEEISMPVPQEQETVPLAPWSRLAPFLRQRLGRLATSHRLDLRGLTRQVASGLPWDRLPRLIRPSWGASAIVLWDISPEMEPFQLDAARLLRRLKRERGRQGLQIRQCYGPPTTLRVEPGVPVLTLSALGQLQSDSDLRTQWLEFGTTLRASGHRLTALVPASSARWFPGIAACFRSAAWDRWQRLPRHFAGRGSLLGDPSNPTVAYSERLTLLLDLLTPASRISPGLLRRIRLLLGPDADAALEHDVWFHPDTDGSESGLYFGFREGAGYELRQDRLWQRAEHPDTRDLVLKAKEIIGEEHRRYCSPLEALAADCRGLLGPNADPGRIAEVELLLGRAVERLRQLAETPGSSAGYRSGLPAWFYRFVEHGLSPALRADRATAERVAQGLALARKFMSDTSTEWPAGLAVPAALAELRKHQGTVRPQSSLYRMASANGGLRIIADTATVHGVASAHIHVAEPVVHMTAGSAPIESWTSFALDRPPEIPLVEDMTQVVIESDWERVRLRPAVRPFWASRWFCDRSGAVAELRTGGEIHQFRWGVPVQLPDDVGNQVVGGNRQFSSAFGQEFKGGVLRFGWVPTSRPRWSTRLWADKFGVAAEVRVGGVPFVLRWIPPGRFLMGSPEDEPGRWTEDNREGPQHEVTISRGFWLGETPITQGQWRAVVEATQLAQLRSRILTQTRAPLNPSPSYFRGPPELPVEQVTWYDCRNFCQQFSDLLRDGPRFNLPTEAQWEYACRAGTSTAIYTGPLMIPGEHNGPELDPIAWYGGNSGRELEVMNPFDSSGWPEKQYQDSSAGTHRVKLKRPNAWGLYDTLGNVWEWCADEWGDYPAELQLDPFRDGTEDARRVVHGGSWRDQARVCRASIRGGGRSCGRSFDRGFRLAAGLPVQAAEPQGRRGEAGAEGRTPKHPSTAKRLH